MIPPDISAGIQLPVADELYKSVQPADALVVGFQKFAQPNVDTIDLLVAASPAICRVVIDSGFQHMPVPNLDGITDPLQKSSIQRELEAREEYRVGQSQRWAEAMRLPMTNLGLIINSIHPNQQAYMLFGEKIVDPADFADGILANIARMSRSRMSLCARVGHVSGGDAEMVVVDTVNVKKTVIS
jgi:hypothetical protein